MVLAQRPAGSDDHALGAQAVGELVAAAVTGAQPDEVRLAVGDLEAHVAQRGEQPAALARDRLAAPLDLRVAGAEGVLDRGLRERVDAQHRRHRGQQVAVGRDRVAGPQARQPVDLRERAHDEQAREGLHEPQTGVHGLAVLEVHERLVEEHGHVRGQRREQRTHLLAAHVLAGGIVRVAEHHHSRSLAHGVEEPAALDRDRAGASVRREQRIERVGGPGHHELVAFGEEREGGRLEQLGGAVPECDPLGVDPVALGEQTPDRRRVAVRVALYEAARAGDRRRWRSRSSAGRATRCRTGRGPARARVPGASPPAGARGAAGSARARRGPRTAGSSHESPRWGG